MIDTRSGISAKRLPLLGGTALGSSRAIPFNMVPRASHPIYRNEGAGVAGPDATIVGNGRAMAITGFQI